MSRKELELIVFCGLLGVSLGGIFWFIFRTNELVLWASGTSVVVGLLFSMTEVGKDLWYREGFWKKVEAVFHATAASFMGYLLALMVLIRVFK